MPLIPVAIAVATTAGAAGWIGGANWAAGEARDRVLWWLTAGAAVATLYLAWRTS